MRICASLLLLGFLFSGRVAAQSTAYVLQAGPTLGIQKWNDGGDRQVLFKYHVALALESVNNESDKASLFVQGGYHVKGSAVRSTYLFQGGGINTVTKEYRFNNLSLALGAKQKFTFGATGRSRYFYYGAIRGDYTLSTNIDELSNQFGIFTSIYDPQIAYMNRWMVGLSIGGGLQFAINDLMGGQLTVSVCPDVTNQYRQPALRNIIDPYNPGQPVDLGERRIRNTALEISLGLRLLHKVEYVE